MCRSSPGAANSTFSCLVCFRVSASVSLYLCLSVCVCVCVCVCVRVCQCLLAVSPPRFPEQPLHGGRRSRPLPRPAPAHVPRPPSDATRGRPWIHGARGHRRTAQRRLHAKGGPVCVCVSVSVCLLDGVIGAIKRKGRLLWCVCLCGVEKPARESCAMLCSLLGSHLCCSPLGCPLPSSQSGGRFLIWSDILVHLGPQPHSVPWVCEKLGGGLEVE